MGQIDPIVWTLTQTGRDDVSKKDIHPGELPSEWVERVMREAKVTDKGVDG